MEEIERIDGKELAKQIEEEKTKLILFMVVRNSKVLPAGIKLGKTEKEITEMTKETIKSLEKMIDFQRAKELYNL